MGESPAQNTSHNNTDMQRGNHRHSTKTATRTLTCTCRATHRQADFSEPVCCSVQGMITRHRLVARHARARNASTKRQHTPLFLCCFCFRCIKNIFISQSIQNKTENENQRRQCCDEDFPQSTKVFPQSIERPETRFLPISRAPTARDA